MPNKPVNHTDLDNAIKNSLLNTPAEAKVEWEEIYNMLPKKSAVVKGPLADIGFSLNSFAGVAAAGTSLKLKSALQFAKRSSFSISIVAGSIVIGIGAYLMYNSFSKNTITQPEHTTPPPHVQEEVKHPENQVLQTNPEETNIHTTPENINGSATLITNNSLTTGTQVAENPTPNGKPLLKPISQQNFAGSTPEPVLLKTGEPSQTETYDFSAQPNEAVAPDTTEEAAPVSSESKKSKVIYYKESLSLDKLEQQLSTPKDTVNKPAENKGGLFRKHKRAVK